MALRMRSEGSDLASITDTMVCSTTTVHLLNTSTNYHMYPHLLYTFITNPNTPPRPRLTPPPLHNNLSHPHYHIYETYTIVAILHLDYYIMYTPPSTKYLKIPHLLPLPKNESTHNL